jgi:hypothetical protein
MNYTIWLEFEHVEPVEGDEDEDDFCNVIVNYEDGTSKGYNVWTIGFYRKNIQSILDDVETNGYSVEPDIIVTELTREHITKVLKEILPSYS